ncbi:uncharacterized protein LOC123566542 isoform X2 [Mercenaria mercenaria]|uniref:uncharacterized protein LOC123566542 isoform X2 n=1 Tax=Mercenaria mercenaria TaxID=6596 RepID=UPI00234F0CDA|nr:uncharacterized protein LOC123566542 isoform X2 [Mercenaria mercenaria]
MGQQTSRNEGNEKQLEQQREIKYIIDCLNHHKNNVYGVAHSVETQNSYVEELLQNMRRLERREKDGDIIEDDIEDKTDVKIHLKVTKNTRRLLGSIQCQSNSLQESFDALNQCIMDALHQFKQPDLGSSVDQKYSRKWIVYEDSPKQPIRDIREAFMEQAESLRTLQLSESTLSTHNKQLSKDNEFLRSQLQTFKSTIQVQIYYQSRGEMMSKVLDELKLLLASNTGKERNKVQFIDCLDKNDINPDIPLFVLCINASRIGTDVATTLQNLKGCEMENTALLIFHHKNEHALPTQTSNQVLAGPGFKALRGIYDLAFLTGKGMYDCEMNTRAVADIIGFICKVSGETGFNRDAMST